MVLKKCFICCVAGILQITGMLLAQQAPQGQGAGQRGGAGGGQGAELRRLYDRFRESRISTWSQEPAATQRSALRMTA
jgi:hypothetical protein